jgi:site-specific recombinase XerD
MASPQQDLERLRTYLKRRNYAAHTIDSDTLDLQFFFAAKAGPPATVTHLDVEQFVAQQHEHGFRPTTLNRRLYASLADPLWVLGAAATPSGQRAKP